MTTTPRLCSGELLTLCTILEGDTSMNNICGLHVLRRVRQRSLDLAARRD